ncbi:hypothetical protein P4S72_12740 [Vibrio sp. PP-XX7]
MYYPGIDVVAEMFLLDMMSATRSFETNVEVLTNVKKYAARAKIRPAKAEKEAPGRGS